MIRAILACDDEWGIGRDNTLPWPHNPADLKWFKDNTLNSVIVMGRNTWESLPFKPLPNRENVVITSSDVSPEGADVVCDLRSFNKILPQMQAQGKDVWIIGGGQLVNAMLPYIEEIWLSRISGTYNCDTFLPRELIETTFTLYSSRQDGDVYVDKWRAY